MVPTIGIMIGFYIFTRMIELLAVKNQTAAIRIFAILTMLITFFSVMDLLFSGKSAGI